MILSVFHLSTSPVHSHAGAPIPSSICSSFLFLSLRIFVFCLHFFFSLSLSSSSFASVTSQSSRPRCMLRRIHSFFIFSLSTHFSFLSSFSVSAAVTVAVLFFPFVSHLFCGVFLFFFSFPSHPVARGPPTVVVRSRLRQGPVSAPLSISFSCNSPQQRRGGSDIFSDSNVHHRRCSPHAPLAIARPLSPPRSPLSHAAVHQPTHVVPPLCFSCFLPIYLFFFPVPFSRPPAAAILSPLLLPH